MSLSFNRMNISQDHRSISRFIGYALCAADEALKDARWQPSEQEQKERTVSICCLQIICDRVKPFSLFLW